VKSRSPAKLVQLFAPRLDPHRQRQPGQLGVRRPGGGVEGERYQSGARLDHRQLELARDAVAPRSLAPIFGIDRPPVATTTAAACTRPQSLSSS